MTAAPILSVDGLSMEFTSPDGKRMAVLDRVSLDLRTGQTLGLVGESGSGKSVTALAIMGLLDRSATVTAGRILFEGRDLRQAGWAGVRGRRMSMVFQHPRRALNPRLTIGQQLADVLAVHRGLSGREARAAAMARLAEVGIAANRVGAYPFELSGGMCQRVMIALALAGEPAVLIADEPTTGLDVTTQAVIMDLLASLARARGMAMLLITHNLGLAAERCDDIVAMHGGRMVERPPAAHPHMRESTPQPATPAMTLLEICNLCKVFPLRRGSVLHAVDDVSFSVARGEVVGLVGQSGCGKTTLARLIARLDDPTTGSIVFDGVDIGCTPSFRAARAPWRRRIQMVFQDPYESLDPRKSIRDAVRLPLIRLLGLRGAALESRVDWALNRVHLAPELGNRLPHQLSGGQLARAGLARAIAPKPALLILDEPTSALDVAVQAVILHLLDEMRRELGLSMLFVSHDLTVVRSLCQRVLVMDAGRITEAGPSADLVAAVRGKRSLGGSGFGEAPP